VVCNVIETRDGRIVREREYYDRMAVLVQLGVVNQVG
jgi:ketosteroid isomerase-like protein